MKIADVVFWLQRSILEVRKSNGSYYSLDSLCQACCAVERALQEAGQDLDIFEQFEFAEVQAVLDAELK